ncbi:hypothetical protein AB1K89_00805 [Sporosarcina sp. 179-K 8C2 HS]|uniref:hypothetical protein n=1 Tax=Sporosarcina sp. 179-K 8C2 HS TaxID=3142387 RepID=UPI0039A35EE7
MVQQSSQQPMAEQQFQTDKKQILQKLHKASQTIQQMSTLFDSQSVQQAQQQLQQASQLLNQLQGHAVTQSPTTVQQQLEQVRKQIDQAAQTLQLIETLNMGNKSFKK